MAVRHSKPNIKKIYTSKAKIVGKPPAKTVAGIRLRTLNKMWNAEAANWYQYGMPRNNVRTMNPQYQAYMPTVSNMSQTYAYMPQQQYYYDQSRSQPNVNTLTMTMGQRLAQAQPRSMAYSQSMAQQAQQQAWYDYQAQQPAQNYSYWYGNNFDMGQTQAGNTTQAVHQVTEHNVLQSGMQYGARQTIPARAEAHPRKVGGSRHDGIYNGSGSGSLNRIDSITSFKNNRGLRIRNSQQDMEEYQRVAARTLRKKEKKEAAQTLEMLKIKLQKRLSKEQVQIKPIQSQNLVIEEPLQSRGSSFFRRMGFFSGKRKEGKTQEQPSSQISQDNRSYKKPNFLKRLLRGSKYPSVAHVNPMIQELERSTKNTKVQQKSLKINQAQAVPQRHGLMPDN